MKKVLFLCLIITTLFFVSCNKNKANDEESNPAPAPTTTPLEGRWVASDSISTLTVTLNLTFSGTNISYATTMVDNSTTPPDTTVITLSGTFRLDSGNLYTTFNAASCNNNGTTITDVATLTASNLLPVPVDNTERRFGSYSINGSTLAITDNTDPANPVTVTFTKQ